LEKIGGISNSIASELTTQVEHVTTNMCLA